MSEQRFFRFLQERIGLDVESVGAAMVERALRQRCTLVQAADLDDYWLRLQQSSDEQQALIEAVIVPETWFFRYPESFTALAGLAHKRAAELAGARPLRILSLPCSTGEEPYSIAMALLDGGLSPGAFRVDGIDISPSSVAKGEQALYGRNSFRGSELAFRERHFSPSGDTHRLDERVRQQVSLQAGNVLDPALKAREGLYDFVFCRNLLIYFDVPTQQRVFEVLKRLIHAQGVLFIGPAEGSLLARLGMRPLGIAQSFAYVRQDDAPPPVAKPLPVARQPVAPPPPRLVALPPRAARSSAVPAAPVPAQGEAQLLALIARQANAGENQQARADCERYLRQFAPKAQVYYWLGLLSDTEGDAAQAITHYRKALYLEPQHPEALMHLAMLLAAQGDDAGARRLQERAARAGRESER
ncbi:chemotaxis protein methyltransferase WspC [Pseudomonas sp. TE6288]|uniref:CheR family methyltransferase n=1 Tax=Pseudomonas TaxID=286 RepID=UPI000C88DBC5|nr:MULTISPECIES: protein-glutamate O-methyltransferase CheR [Pseudomonas]MDF9755421.1 chemotaxis protein methyltransferase WspC [Pseudomonas hunanensis]PNA02826.1 chemotaxis protein CheR [Pseudomonas sp. FW305-42]PNA27556.1 chemotaxis protein CheR [Pseudomonas sp. MPR-R1B]PNB29726.1 chemotaxis protein CheR [Pseudomonas sp. DP16D-E2]PNB45282.1 chemotaxis protein CheR [Pseudomonas sp. FW305-17]